MLKLTLGKFQEADPLEEFPPVKTSFNPRLIPVKPSIRSSRSTSEMRGLPRRSFFSRLFCCKVKRQVVFHVSETVEEEEARKAKQSTATMFKA